MRAPHGIVKAPSSGDPAARAHRSPRRPPAHACRWPTSSRRVSDDRTTGTFLLLRLEGEGEAGWGECVAEAHPYYSSETTETTWHIVTEFLAPRVVGKSFAHPREVFPALARVRGHNMAKAAVEMAAWDLYARLQGQPLSAVLGGTRDRIASGVSIGIQDSLDQLVAKVEKELAAGYQRIKIKIKPGWDLNAVEAVRAKFPDIQLMVDANAAYSVGGRRPPGQARRLRPDDDRAAARVRRRHGSRPAAAGDRHPDLPRRVDPHRAHRPRRHRGQGLQDHQHQAGPGRRPCRVDSPPRSLPAARHPGVAWRHARVGHRPGPQHPPGQPAQLHAARATSPPASATTCPT